MSMRHAAIGAAHGLCLSLRCRPRLRPRVAACLSRVRGMAAGSPKEVTVVEEVTAAGHSRYVQNITSGVHLLKGDLMPEALGSNAGPSPKEYVMVGLATCTSMTIRMFAESSGWPLDMVRVTVREDCKDGAHLPEGLSVTVQLDGDRLTPQQRERLLRAAGRCPVKRMLGGELKNGIQTELVGGGGSATAAAAGVSG